MFVVLWRLRLAAPFSAISLSNSFLQPEFAWDGLRSMQSKWFEILSETDPCLVPILLRGSPPCNPIYRGRAIVVYGAQTAQSKTEGAVHSTQISWGEERVMALSIEAGALHRGGEEWGRAAVH